LYSFLLFFNAGIELYHQIKNPFDFKQGIEGTTSANAKRITSPPHSKSVSSSSGQLATAKHNKTSQVSLFYVTKPFKLT